MIGVVQIVLTILRLLGEINWPWKPDTDEGKLAEGLFAEKFGQRFGSELKSDRTFAGWLRWVWENREELGEWAREIAAIVKEIIEAINKRPAFGSSGPRPGDRQRMDQAEKDLAFHMSELETAGQPENLAAAKTESTAKKTTTKK